MSTMNPYEPEALPEQWTRCAEKVELLRTAAQSALNRSRNGRDLDPEARRWAEHWAAHPRLQRPLGDGRD
jgi:hypothetical protein